MRLWVLLAVMLFSFNIYAGALSTNDLGEFSKLTTYQQAAIVSEIAKQADANAVPDLPTTPKQMQEWVSVGSAIGQGLAETAKQLGVATNEFAKSTVGVIAIVLIVWKVIGADLVQLCIGVAWLCFWIPFCIWMIKRVMFELVCVPMGTGEKVKERYVWKLKEKTRDEDLGAKMFMAFFYIAIGTGLGWITILV